MSMENRQLGGSGLKVPVLSLGTGTFGGGGELFKAWGTTDVAEASRLIDICLEAGLTMFDSADIYSQGMAEEILGAAIKGRRDRLMISTKATFRSGPGPNDVGSSRHHLTRSVEGCLRRLQIDYIDLFQLHGFDALTPAEEVLDTLAGFVRSGKIGYIGCSNFSGWHLMKALAVSDRHGWPRYVGASGVLLAHRPRLRVGADAPGTRPEGGHRRLEPLGLGPADRATSPRAAAARDIATQQPTERRHRAARGDGICLSRRRGDRPGGGRDGQDRAADRAQLAARAADCGHGHRRRRATKRNCARTWAPSVGT